jgi:AsmA-like C-terminal region
VITIIAAAGSRTPTLRRLVVDTLSDRLDSDVELQSFSVDTFPTVDVRGEGLVVRLRGRRDVPPLVQVKSFRITGGVFGLLGRPRRFRTVTVDRLEINIPPGGPQFRQPAAKPAAPPPDAPSSSPIHIDTLHSTDAMLRLLRRDPTKAPREFPIHRLLMRQVGITQRMPFEAELTNPLPRGFIKTEGRFGPWSAGDPDDTPVEGKYVFDNADLSTIDGIAGILSSTGTFTGQLGRIAVSGETRTPDFRLDIADHALPLTTTFDAIVDGTNGDTYLNPVNARLGQSAIVAVGKVVDDTPGVKGRTIDLDVKVADGRLDDFLFLAVKSPRPVLTGRISLTSDFLLSPGPGDVVDRLLLGGAFKLSSAQFTDAEVRGKLAAMSARAKGEPDDVAAQVISEFGGRFRLAGTVLSLSDLNFRMPGAAIHLTGTYGLRSEALDFDGTLRMEATISEAAGDGVKSTLLKIVDPLFRKKGAGTVLPIKVQGTRKEPQIKVDMVKALTPK